MELYLTNGDYIHASECGNGTTQDILRSLADLLDEVEKGNTTEWIDKTPEVFLPEKVEKIINEVHI